MGVVWCTGVYGCGVMYRGVWVWFDVQGCMGVVWCTGV